MQLKERIKEHKGIYDCTGCQKEMRCMFDPHNHQTVNNEIAVKQSKMNVEAEANVPFLVVLDSLNICPVPMISDFSHVAYSIFSEIGGSGVRSLQDYQQQPALWLAASGVISSELANINRGK